MEPKRFPLICEGQDNTVRHIRWIQLGGHDELERGPHVEQIVVLGTAV